MRAGLGVLVGAAVGGFQAYRDQSPRVARDGLGTPAHDRDLQRSMTAAAGYALRW